MDNMALDPEYEIDPPLDGRTAIDYDLAGRPDLAHTFADLRSPGKARRRHNTRKEKYYSFRGVNVGQLGRPHYVPNHPWDMWYKTPLPEAAVQDMTKQQLYYEAQTWPRPPQVHRSKPWEKRDRGSVFRHWGPKHAKQRFADDIEDAEGFGFTYLVTGDDYGLSWKDKMVYVLSQYGADVHVKGGPGDDGCGCWCYLCHRECSEEQRREREAKEVLRLEEAGWDVLTSPSSTDDAAEDEDWDCASMSSQQTPAAVVEDDWILPNLPNDRPATAPPFSSLEPFDSDGYLPYTHSHLLSDLCTSRCRACIAEYLTNMRMEEYRSVRLSDAAYLRGIPSGLIDYTCRAAVQQLYQALPFLADLEAGVYGRVIEVTRRRGFVAGDIYAMFGTPAVEERVRQLLMRGRAVLAGDAVVERSRRACTWY